MSLFVHLLMAVLLQVSLNEMSIKLYLQV